MTANLIFKELCLDLQGQLHVAGSQARGVPKAHVGYPDFKNSLISSMQNDLWFRNILCFYYFKKLSP